jgi:hypothetical protein
LRRLVGILIVLLVVVAFPSVASAQTEVVVTRFDDPQPEICDPGNCSLRGAVPRFDPNVVVVLPAGDYVLNSQLGIGIGTTLRGPSGGLATIRLDAAAPPDHVVSVGTSLTAAFHNLRITGGRDDDQGGGIEVNTGAILNVYDSEITGNTAPSGGGVWNAGTLNLERTTVAGNTATGDTSGPGQGGGVFSQGSATFTNSTVSGNTANAGGGIHTAGPLTLQNTTIAQNTGAGLHDASGQSVMRGTLLAGNQGGACTGSAGGGAEQYNVADDGSCGLDGTGDRVVADALVAPLGANGGPTRTHALYTGSQAIGTVAAGCPAVDQRSVARATPCAAGAYEGSIAGGPPPPAGDDLPAPQAGENVNVIPRGKVRVRLPGRKRFRELTEAEQLPVGTVVDTLRGQVTIVAAGNQRAVFTGGIFRIGQGKGARPLTTLKLVEKLSCPKRGRASAAAKKKKRRLWGDGKGRFRTDGQYSAATVRGTKWLVEDRCASTLTRVTQGRVSVRDKVKRKTVIVRAGKRYVAKRRG